MSENFQERVVHELGLMLEPIALAARSPEHRRRLLLGLGWDLDAITGLPISKIDAVLIAVGALYGQVADLADEGGAGPSELETLRQASEALGAVADAVARLQDLAKALEGTSVSPPPGFERLPVELVEHLGCLYLGR